MKAHNHIDDMFQQHFAESAIPMSNQEELWQRISEKKDDKRRGFWWFGVLGIGLLIVSGYTILNTNTNTDKNISTVVSTENYRESDNPINENEAIPAIIESEGEEEKLSSSPIPIAIGTNTSTQIIPSQKSNNIKSSAIGISNNEVIQDAIVNVVLDNDEIEESNPIVAEAANDDLDETLEEAVNLKGREATSILNSIPSHESNLPTLLNFKNPYKDAWDNCEVKETGHFFADVYGQAGLPMDEIGFSQANSDQIALRDLWDTRFTPKASWHAGAQIGYELPIGLRISAGAEYQEIVTEYADNQRVTEVIRVWDPQAFFEIDMNGDRVWVGDTVTAVNIYDRRFARKNTHQLLHIPLQLSYDIYKRPGFHIALDASAALNISKSYEGQYIRSDQTLIEVDENNNDNYISKDIGISFSAGLHFGKYLNDDWEVYASPRFRYNPNSFLLDTETLKVTRNILGLRAGLRYHF